MTSHIIYSEDIGDGSSPGALWACVADNGGIFMLLMVLLHSITWWCLAHAGDVGNMIGIESYLLLLILCHVEWPPWCIGCWFTLLVCCRFVPGAYEDRVHWILENNNQPFIGCLTPCVHMSMCPWTTTEKDCSMNITTNDVFCIIILSS